MSKQKNNVSDLLAAIQRKTAETTPTAPLEIPPTPKPAEREGPVKKN